MLTPFGRLRAILAALLILLLVPAIQLTSSPSSNAAEVSTSTLGYNFAITTPPGYSDWVWTLYLSSSETGTASVDFPTGTDTPTVVINPGITSSVVVPANDEMGGSDTDQISNKVVRITSTVPIAVYGCSRQAATSDCTNFIPISSWGNRYRPLSYPTTIGGYGDRITVLTGNDTATITMKFKTTVVTASGTFSAGSETSTVMAPNKVWTLEAINTGQGFTGSLITSTAPIGVIAGADCTFAFGGACDTNVEMVPPESSWGKNFYLNNYKNASKTGSGVRILASQDSTTVTISGDVTRSVTLNAGEVFSELLFASGSDQLNLSVAIVASKPVLLGHYMISGSYTSLGGTDIGDPSLSYMPPFEQFLSEYTVVSAGGFKAQFINVIIPTAVISTLKLDGASVSSSLFRQIGSTTWSSAQINTSTGSHNLVAGQPFGIEIYGADGSDSYAYVGGANYSALSTVASLRLNASSTTGTVGQEVCIPVTVLDASDAPVLGVRVDGTTSGTNSGLFPSATTNSSGVANICYVGALAGTDTLTFSANGFTTTVTIVWSLAIPAISYSPSTLSLATSVAMPTLTPTNTGGTIASWAIAPALPTGLSLNTSTGVISGTPSSDTASSSYTVTATNAAGSGTTTLTISVIPAVQPTISYSPSTRNFTLDSTITSMTPTTSGTFPSWSVSPALPRGLSLNAQSGAITGTPTRTTSAATYRVTATNSAGSSFTDLTLAVVESIPSISFNITTFSFVKNSAISIISPLNTGSPATSWTISPALSAGLSFNSLTGQISGTPSASVSATTYTVTGTNTAGSASATVQIAVVDNLLAPSITYATSSASLTVGTAMSALSPTNSGGAVASYSVSPSVSNGINFSTSTGIFSGTLTASLASTVYTITATNATGTSTTTVTLSSGTLSSLSNTSGLVPAFSAVTSGSTGFKVDVTNYDANYTWSVTVTSPATVILISSGFITVTGLTGQGVQATVTVTTSRTGYLTQSASVTGSTTPPPPPPSFLITTASPKISQTEDSIICQTGSFIFLRYGITKETPKLDYQEFVILENDIFGPQFRSKENSASFKKTLFKTGSTLSCIVFAQQENAAAQAHSFASNDLVKFWKVETEAISRAELENSKTNDAIAYYRKKELARLLKVRSATFAVTYNTASWDKAQLEYEESVYKLEMLAGDQRAAAAQKMYEAIIAAKEEHARAIEDAGIYIISR
jgi:hypothetical protein